MPSATDYDPRDARRTDVRARRRAARRCGAADDRRSGGSGRVPGLAGVRPRHRAGRDGAAPGLVLRPPRARSVARRLDVPRGARQLQPDVRCRAAPGHDARGGGYFFHELVAMVRAWFHTLRTRRIETPDERLAWIVVVATIPAGVVGLALEDTITAHLGDPWQIAILLAVFAGVLWLVDRRPATRDAHELSLKEGLVVGIAQALALAPGVSRSGITITAGRLFRLDRDAAARLSFLLLVPTVLGAVLLKGRQGRPARRSAAGLEGPVPGRRPLGLGHGPACDPVAARLRPPPHLRAVRRLPPRRGRTDRAPDHRRRPRGDLLSGLDPEAGRTTGRRLSLLDITSITVRCRCASARCRRCSFDAPAMRSRFAEGRA